MAITLTSDKTVYMTMYTVFCLLLLIKRTISKYLYLRSDNAVSQIYLCLLFSCLANDLNLEYKCAKVVRDSKSITILRKQQLHVHAV